MDEITHLVNVAIGKIQNSIWVLFRNYEINYTNYNITNTIKKNLDETK